jgi:hypothetical protein
LTMAIVIPVEPACAREGGLKSNFAGTRCTGGEVAACFGPKQLPNNMANRNSTDNLLIISLVLI